MSKTDSLGEKMGVVSYMKNIFKDLDVKLVPYKNTTEVKAAFLVGEIDSAFLTTGRASEIENKVELLNTQEKDKGKFRKWKNNDLTLNYYLMVKNVDDKIIDALKNNKTLGAIASKKNMMPVTYKSLNKHSKTIHRASDFHGGYDPVNGCYLSRQMFDADFETDLNKLNLSKLVCNSHYLKHLDDRNTDDIFRIVSLKSLDGTNEM